jgi:phosphorylcholine metabolism protein LicD
VSDYEKLFEILVTSKGILDELNIKWSLAWGSLLGAVREQDFIQNGEEDLDLFLINTPTKEYMKFAKILIDHGYDAHRHTSNPGKFFHGYAGLDIWRIGLKPGDGSDFYWFKHFPFQSKYFKDLKVGKIKDVECPILNHSEEFLEIIYGDWRTPSMQTAPFSTFVKKLYAIKRGENEKILCLYRNAT